MDSDLSGYTLTEEVFEKGVVEVENLTNSHPLTYLSANHADPQLSKNANVPRDLVPELEICIAVAADSRNLHPLLTEMDARLSTRVNRWKEIERGSAQRKVVRYRYLWSVIIISLLL